MTDSGGVYSFETVEGYLTLNTSDRTISLTGQGGGSLNGATAIVETAGEIEKRISATRVVMTGLIALAWRKKKDNRELYIMVDGPDYTLLAQVDPTKAPLARRFTAAIGTVAKGGEISSSTLSLVTQSKEKKSSNDVAGMIIFAVIFLIIYFVFFA